MNYLQSSECIIWEAEGLPIRDGVALILAEGKKKANLPVGRAKAYRDFVRTGKSKKKILNWEEFLSWYLKLFKILILKDKIGIAFQVFGALLDKQKLNFLSLG